MALGVLGTMGAILSVTGIFGMAAMAEYSVSKRLKELGIRMALGSQHKEVLQATLGRAFKLLALGSAAGLLIGILASKVLAFIVYQATPRSAATGRRSLRNGVDWAASRVDPSPPRAVDRARNTAPRAVNQPYRKSLRVPSKVPFNQQTMAAHLNIQL
jgi:ABC-type antimicrobial peptide transport system permease subunit